MNFTARFWMVSACSIWISLACSADDKKQTDQEVSDLVDRIRPSLVKVLQGGRQGLDGLGSGFIIREDGLIATNKHVIGEARRIQIETSDGKKHDVTEVFASDVHSDLAIVKIAQKGLKPLQLGDSDGVKQGQRIVAMGNPQGLDFSFVEGVVSAVREIEENQMIQVAMPIERGNSGGPLMDTKGRVLGLLTLKSMKTDNLGFAMPVNELKRLFESPNPVPMSRWLTIGVLDPRSWRPLMGGEWTQHAGVVKSEMPGDGFGGRSICLWVADQPQKVFEVSVSVKLESEDGAAGLVFCSDEGDRHYGFYPSNGKLRLTRFDGPDVYSWTVLAEVEADAYKPDEWNSLRVRVDEEAIQCYVNGRQVLDQKDDGLRGGRVGLCKFRAPSAEFKAFKLGTDLSEKPIVPELAEQIRDSLNGFLQNGGDKGKVLDHLLAEPGAGRQLIAEQRKLLEQKVVKLKEMEKELHRRAVTRELIRQLGKKESEIDLLRCALLISRHDNPEVDLESYLRSFSRLVDDLKSDAAMKKGTQSAVRRLRDFLFEENGFHGSRHDYSSNSNSYINEVLDDREGLPITLAVVFLEMANRLGIKEVSGLALPGRFMVGYRTQPSGELRIFDVFDGGKEMSRSELEKSFTTEEDAGENLDDAYFEPAERKAIVVRMIRNLLSNSMDGDRPTVESLPYLNLLLELEPSSAADRFTRAMLRGMGGDKPGAREDVQWLISQASSNLSDEQRFQLQQWLDSLQE